jgi:hypothetical protein
MVRTCAYMVFYWGWFWAMYGWSQRLERLYPRTPEN